MSDYEIYGSWRAPVKIKVIGMVVMTKKQERQPEVAEMRIHRFSLLQQGSGIQLNIVYSQHKTHQRDIESGHAWTEGPTVKAEMVWSCEMSGSPMRIIWAVA